MKKVGNIYSVTEIDVGDIYRHEHGITEFVRVPDMKKHSVYASCTSCRCVSSPLGGIGSHYKTSIQARVVYMGKERRPNSNV